jgi:hypothetical protein
LSTANQTAANRYKVLKSGSVLAFPSFLDV